ncbi:hypothetical protein PsYK624_048400 [Phanerochaete sordida]|uniref:Uncharacterized protein n=1 Tax=Phanerochaete sordida TaxID=48140 RepID=A0A9P3G633_9APHY|nr:hypothetical protein PsYK624_048400 [Phanerochaete sordida]
MRSNTGTITLSRTSPRALKKDTETANCEAEATKAADCAIGPEASSMGLRTASRASRSDICVRQPQYPPQARRGALLLRRSR